ncbi:MAG: HAMP domain-containing histidine kinase [Myxococcales bacterium]|nr:HAMP domain-containing histidine kinase [Myxococcales bacterium]
MADGVQPPPGEADAPGQEQQEALREAQRALEEAQARLVQSEKMASLGMLVAGIAHEINTPIGAVASMHDTLVRAVARMREVLDHELPGGVDGEPRLTKLLGIIEDANRVIADGTSRVTTIVRRLRSFARLDEAELEGADLNEGLEDTLTLIHHELKHGIAVARDFAPLPKVDCFRGRLNQVFLNLLMNARQAITGTGTIELRTWSDDAYVYVSVTDSGVGIAPEHLDRIFEPGFTTKGVGVGTGLGLSICRQIVEEHCGEIWAESVLGQGSTFTLKIPRDVKARHEARRLASIAQNPATGSGSGTAGST